MTAVGFALHLLSPVSVSFFFGFPVAHDPIHIMAAVGIERYALAVVFRVEFVPTEAALTHLSPDASGLRRGDAHTALDV